MNIIINGKKVIAKEKDTILKVALREGIYIPNLCYHPSLPPFGSCRLCIVEIDGFRGFPTSCTTPVEEGMKIKTRTSTLNEIRKTVMELILSEHPPDCLTCVKNQKCELQAVAAYLGMDKIRLEKVNKNIPPDNSSPLIDKDLNKCILCGRCVRACKDLRGVGAIDFIFRGQDTIIGTTFKKSLIDSECRFCTACIEVCPTAAMLDKNIKWLPDDKKKECILPCTFTCPANINVPQYIRQITEGKYSEALATIREKVPFPGTLGRVCFHPCETTCRRKDINEAISIKNLKRVAADYGKETIWKKNLKIRSSTGKKVAIVGGGPAGLTCAQNLLTLGHKVTLFECFPKLGGMMRYGIPPYRLPRNILDAEIQEIINLGCEVKTNSKIENLDKLLASYDAVFLASGAHKGMKGNIEGEEKEGVIDGVTFLRDVFLGKNIYLGEEVAVIGGGNVAMDAARVARRQGTKNVYILYRRTLSEMPASPEEIKETEEEGVKIEYLTAPARIEKINGKLKLVCIKMALGEKDASGRRKPVPIVGSDFEKIFNSVILAIGQVPDIPSGWGVEIENGKVRTSPLTGATSREGVFAGGDAVLGAASVIEAIAEGRHIASSIDKYLGGSGIIEETLTEKETPPAEIGRIDDFGILPRIHPLTLTLSTDTDLYVEVQKVLDEEKALQEGKRCLKCDIRLQIEKHEMPPADERSYI